MSKNNFEFQKLKFEKIEKKVEIQRIKFKIQRFIFEFQKWIQTLFFENRRLIFRFQRIFLNVKEKKFDIQSTVSLKFNEWSLNYFFCEVKRRKFGF